MNKLNKLFTIVLVALAAVSCEWRPLIDPSDSLELKVAIELKTVLNVNTSIYNENIPVPELKSEMFRVIFYDTETGAVVSQAFLSEPMVNSEGKNCLGGSVKINPGKYNMVCYNFDMTDTYIRNEDNQQTIQAYTNPISDAVKARYAKSLRAKGGSEQQDLDYDNMDILYEPEHVIVAREIGLEIKQHTGLLVIETEANTVVDTYYLQVHVEGVQWASSASAVISSMAPSNHVGLAQRDTVNSCALFFNLQKSTDDHIQGDNKDVLCTLFNTFGKIPSEHSDLSITFNVITTDGKSYDYLIDMDDVFLTEDAIKRHWLLINKTIVIPEPEKPETGGGFAPVVDDWTEVHGEIII